MLVLILVIFAIALLARPALAVVRFALLSPAGRKNWPRAVWCAFRWRWLARNLDLAYVDKHHKRTFRPRVPFTTAVHVQPVARHILRYPAAKFRPTDHGLDVTVKTIPKVGRAEVEKSAPYLADAWRCARVQVSQREPGRLLVRGLRTDPLLEPLAAVPGPRSAFEPYLGRDEYGVDRWLRLSGITGITVGGLPGLGKTSLVLSLLDQLAEREAVQFVFIDGKGGADYADWDDRAWISVGDDLADAAAAFEDVHALMRSRLATVLADTGSRNAWHRGPTPDYPLIVTVVDECHTFYDEQAVKGSKDAEAKVRTCRSLSGQLVKKGRSVLFVSLLLTQKQTGDAIPTAIRDNCALGLSFGVKTREAAVAALGDAIREYPTVCPTGLQTRPDYIGVLTASLPTGRDPFVRLRVPEVTEEAAAARAADTAHLRRIPTVPVVAEPERDPVLSGL